MRSVVCDRPGALRLTDVAAPMPGADDVLVRIRRVGVCGTDLHIFSGNQPYLAYPRVMGHELSGTVETAPAGSGFAAGDVVTLVPYLSCGRCHACRQHKTNCCMAIQVLGVHRDGGMADFVALPPAFVMKAEGLSLDEAAMVEFLAIGAHAVRRGGIGTGQRVLVVGAGPIGMAVAIFAGLAGASITMLDMRADRLAFCRQYLGVENGVAIGADDVDRLSALTGGDFFDVVFDATGNPKAMERGFGFVAHGGTYVLVSIVSSSISFSDPEFHKRETSLLGSRNATRADFETVMATMRAGHVPVAALATHRMALGDVPARFPGLLDPAAGVVKALIEL
jgi:2-desacetyl-2-hydroxyethyl bacteriochlorophyllide A dehydrogenase